MATSSLQNRLNALSPRLEHTKTQNTTAVPARAFPNCIYYIHRRLLVNSQVATGCQDQLSACGWEGLELEDRREQTGYASLQKGPWCACADSMFASTSSTKERFIVGNATPHTCPHHIGDRTKSWKVSKAYPPLSAIQTVTICSFGPMAKASAPTHASGVSALSSYIVSTPKKAVVDESLSKSEGCEDCCNTTEQAHTNINIKSGCRCTTAVDFSAGQKQFKFCCPTAECTSVAM